MGRVARQIRLGHLENEVPRLHAGIEDGFDRRTHIERRIVDRRRQEVQEIQALRRLPGSQVDSQ